MFGLFENKSHQLQEKLTKLDYQLQNSFKAIKNDMQNLTSWVHYLHQTTQKQQTVIQHIQSIQPQKAISPQEVSVQISQHPQMHYLQNALTRLELKVDHQAKFPEERIEQLTGKVGQIDGKLAEMEQKVSDVWEKLDKVGRPKTVAESRQHFREKIVKKITRHSKDYITNMILSLIKKYNRVSAMNLREIVVEEQALCSKSSFYRFLETIEKAGEVEVISEGKEKVYVYKMVREV